MLNCTDCFEAYEKSVINRKALADIKRCIRRFNELGDFSLIELTNKDEIEEKLDLFFSIEDHNWKGRSNSSMLKTYQAKFHRGLVSEYGGKKCVRLFFLRLNDDFVSGLLTIVHDGVCYLLKAGYDDSFYRYSPSTVLYYLVIKRLFRDDEINCIDFFGPFYEYEKRFGDKTRKRHSLYVYNRNPVSMLFLFCKKILMKLPFIKRDVTGFLRFRL